MAGGAAPGFFLACVLTPAWQRLWGAARAAGAPPFPGAAAEWSTDQLGLVRLTQEVERLVQALSWRQVDVTEFLGAHERELETHEGLRRLVEWAERRDGDGAGAGGETPARAPGEYAQGWRADLAGRRQGATG